MEFKLLRFNPRRAASGVGAAEVECIDGEYKSLLWMTDREIVRNIAEFGKHPELLAARAAYRDGKEYPVREEVA